LKAGGVRAGIFPHFEKNCVLNPLRFGKIGATTCFHNQSFIVFREGHGLEVEI